MSSKDSKADRKEALKREAEEKGISYKELKEQKKKSKEEKKKKKRSRETDKLVTDEDKQHEKENKRMRSWSGEGNELEDAKRVRTRSMDLVEEKKSEDPEPAKKSNSELNPDQWRKEQNITVKQHGSDFYVIPTPFYNFSDAPFAQPIQKSLTSAGFEKPTHIQAQVSFILESFSKLNVLYRCLQEPSQIFLLSLSKRHGP